MKTQSNSPAARARRATRAITKRRAASVKRGTQKVAATISGGMEKVLLRTRQSLRLLEALEKTPLNQARRLADRGFQLTFQTQDKLMSTLKGFGFVTQSDLESLRIRIENLEARVTLLSERFPRA